MKKTSDKTRIFDFFINLLNLENFRFLSKTYKFVKKNFNFWQTNYSFGTFIGVLTP